MGKRAHLQKLETKHAILDEEIKNELKLPHPDTLTLTTLKRQKLQLKDQIHALHSN